MPPLQRLRSMIADTRPLANPHFRRLFVANAITVIGAQLTVVAVPAQIFAISGSSGYVGLTGLFGLAPLVIFGLYGGALADHLDRRTLLVLSTVGIIAASAAFFVQSALKVNNVWVLLGIFAIQQAFFAMNQPARMAVLSSLLPDEQMASAQALNMTLFSFGAIAGPLVGGVLIPPLGYTYLYLLDVLFLLPTMYAVMKLPSLPVAGASGGSPGFKAVWEGLLYLRGRQVLIMSFLVDLIAMVFGNTRAIFPQIAHQTFGGPASGGTELALLYAAMPVGVLLGGIFSGWVARVDRQGVAVLVAIGIWGAAMAAFGLFVGLTPAVGLAMLGFALAAQAVGGAADMVSAAFRNSILLNAADDNVRGRLQGIFIVVVAGGPRLGDFVHGGAAELFGTAWTAAGGGVLVIALLVLTNLVFPRFRRYRLSQGQEAE